MMKKYLFLFLLVASTNLFATTQDRVIENIAPTDSIAQDSIAQDSIAQDSIAQDSLKTNKSLIGKITDWYSNHMNYGSITILMTIESSFIPFPSEIVIPPAAYVASEPESSLHVTDSYIFNVILIVLFGTLGALLGAMINYFLSMWLGRAIIYKFADSKLGHLCLLSKEKVVKAEQYFNKHGKISTFIGRLIPAIRQLISIPAGLSKMPFRPFMLYTFLGAFIWNSILAVLGYIANGNKDIINEYSHELSVAIVAILVIVVLFFVIKKIITSSKRK